MKTLLLSLLAFLAFWGCAREKRLKIAASSVPHAEILEFIAPDMREAGYPIEIVVIDDYNLPNRMLAEGEVDANFFQHSAFLKQQIDHFGYDFVVLAQVHCEPLGLYSSKHEQLEIAKGMRIALPSDPSNERRALELLQDRGLLRLKGSGSTLLDIEPGSSQVQILEVDAPLLVRTLPDVDYAVIPGNFALQGGLLESKKALFLERSERAYPNLLVVRREDSSNEALLKLAQLLRSDKVKNFIQQRYKGALQLCSN